VRCASLLMVLFLLAGCDKLTGAADQKIADAEAIGFACRVSGKTPEDCMKENEAQSPSSVLDGWKSADEDIKSGKLDPNMNNTASPKKDAEADKPAEGGDKPTDDKKTDGKTVDKKDGAATDGKKDKGDKTDSAKDDKAKTDAKAKN
jgi:hypothetical protein